MALFVPCLLVALFFQSSFGWGEHHHQPKTCDHHVDCDYTMCNEYDAEDVIEELWEIPPHLTATATHYKNAVLETLNSDRSESTMAQLTSLTIFALNILTKGSQSTDAPDITCVLPALIKVELERVEERGDPDEYRKAAEDYKELCENAVYNAIYTSLSLVECPAQKLESTPKKSCRCCRSMMEHYLYYTDYPQELKDAIVHLLESSNKSDRLLGVSGIVCGTPLVTKSTAKLMRNENFEKIFRLAACTDEIIDRECCPVREEILTEAGHNLITEGAAIFDETIDEILAE